MTTKAAEAPTDDWYTIRPPTTAELPFIAETTCRVLRPRPSPSNLFIETPVVLWLKEQLPRFQVEPVETLVADADGVVVGFVAMLGAAVRMLYVKRDFRGHRMGLRLMWAAGVDTETAIQVLEETPSWHEWCKRHGFWWERVK